MMVSQQTTWKVHGWRHRLATGLLLCLAIVAQIAPSVHLIAVKHTVCPLHGELMHAGSSQASHVESSQKETFSQPEDLAVDDASEHKHEHCTVAAHRRTAVAAPVFAAALTRAGPCLVLKHVAPSLSVRDTRVAFLLSAPKNSPPV